jgi:hypothetical protein
MHFHGVTFVMWSLILCFLQVHIPCHSDKQWISVTANFIDNCFDVLNPDQSNEKFSKIINTVIHNFTVFFIMDYPHDRFFKIREFDIRYVKVPKHNFRYPCMFCLLLVFLLLFYLFCFHYANCLTQYVSVFRSNFKQI